MNFKRLIIFGSSRSHGDTRKVADAFAKLTGADLIDLNDYNISYFDYEHRNQHDDFLVVFQKLLQYDQIIFATPVYWYTMSAVMKTFFDRISDVLKIRKDLGRQLRGKRMMVISSSSDNKEYPGFDLPFSRSAEYLGMHYDGYMHAWVEDGQVPEVVHNGLAKLAKIPKLEY